MDQNKHASEGEALIENIGKRDDLPQGWRRLYDRLIVDLYKLQPGLRVATTKEKLAELRVYLERQPTPEDDANTLIDQATAASRTACEVCGDEAGGHHISDVYKRLCEAHLRAAHAMEAARLRIFDGSWHDAERWMQSHSVHLGETPADRAARSPDGLEDVLRMIGRIEGGVHF